MEQNLVAVSVNEPGFEYDIHSLVKAFYPECDVKVWTEGKEGASYSSSEGYPDLSINIGKEVITLSVLSTGQEGNSSSFTGKRVEISPTMERSEVKNRLKQLIYAGLSQSAGKQLPWGTLTGIRPTKIPMALLEEGRKDEDILAYMKETYFISDEKGLLSIDIAKREKELLSVLHYKDGYSLYI